MLSRKRVACLFLLFEAAIYTTESRPNPPDIGYFWQVTDFHYDANYSTHGDPGKMCHHSSSSVHYSLGRYGDYKCDAPWNLVLSAISAMKDINSKPDFILWTGDSVAHVQQSTYNEGKIFSLIHNITEALLAQFLDVRIFPSFGNHDPYPSDQMPTHDAKYYGSILSVSRWDRLLPTGADQTFLKGGYYSYSISPKIKVISLNTALYYRYNNVTKFSNDYDPSGQFSWLASELQRSKLSGQKVYIAAHVPPGSFEWVPQIMWFHDDLSKRYLDIIDAYSDVITAHFYGHEHTDTFRVYNSTRGYYNAMFLSPAVTPWKSGIPGLGPNNPSIRLYTYDRTTSDVLDYHQYYLNLTEANAAAAKWRLEYQFTSAYDVDNLKSAVVRQAVKKTVDGSKNKYLLRYLKYNSVSAKEVSCNQTCIQGHRCSMLYQRYPQIAECLSSSGRLHKPHRHFPWRAPTHRSWIVTNLTVILILAVILVIILSFRPSRYVLLGPVQRRFAAYKAFSST